MAAAAGLDLRVVVLDRHPNAGRRPVELEVIPVEGRRPSDRAQAYGREGHPWIPPSPNIPTPDSALVYAGSGLFEGTELSRGRGTTRPFEVIGAPYLDFRLADRLNALELPGVEFREAYFTPTFSTYAGEQCCGVEVHVTDLWRFRPVQAAVAMLVEVHRYAGFGWRMIDDPDPYWIDRLAGSTRLRTLVEKGAGVDEILAAWRSDRRTSSGCVRRTCGIRDAGPEADPGRGGGTASPRAGQGRAMPAEERERADIRWRGRCTVPQTGPIPPRREDPACPTTCDRST